MGCFPFGEEGRGGREGGGGRLSGDALTHLMFNKDFFFFFYQNPV